MKAKTRRRKEEMEIWNDKGSGFKRKQERGRKHRSEGKNGGKDKTLQGEIMEKREEKS